MIEETSLNKYGEPDYSEHNESYYIVQFTQLILNKFANHKTISVPSIVNDLDLDSEDKARFWHLQDKIKKSLVFSNKVMDMIPKLNTEPAKLVDITYLHRESNHLQNREKNNNNAENTNQKTGFWKIAERVALILTILGIIVGFILIPKDTPYVGVEWWKDVLGL